MKKFRFLLPLLAIFLFVPKAHAWWWETSADSKVFTKYRINLGTTIVSTSAVVVDLSDTTNYPHKDNGYLIIEGLRVSVDKAASSTSTVRVGVITQINESSGTVNWFFTKENLLNVSNTEPDPYINYGIGGLRLQVTPPVATGAGALQFGLTNETTSSAVYQTDVFLPSTTGGAKPGIGDLVMDVNKQVGVSATYIVEVIYSATRK